MDDAEQTLGREKEQVKPDSVRQVVEHPSFDTVLPSSHCSPSSSTRLPQDANHWRETKYEVLTQRPGSEMETLITVDGDWVRTTGAPEKVGMPWTKISVVGRVVATASTVRFTVADTVGSAAVYVVTELENMGVSNNGELDLSRNNEIEVIPARTYSTSIRYPAAPIQLGPF